MQFVRLTWKYLVAVKDGLVLLAMLLFFWALYAALSSQPNAGSVRNGTLLPDLNGAIVEEATQPDFSSFLTGDGNSTLGQYQLRNFVRYIDDA